jgi:hypothetical protein
MPHPLEDKVIIMKWQESDREDFGSSLITYEYQREKLVAILAPHLLCEQSRDLNVADIPLKGTDERFNAKDWVIQQLLREGITDVYSLMGTDSILNINLKDYYNGDDWHRIETIYYNEFLAQLFADNGITLHLLDADDNFSLVPSD